MDREHVTWYVRQRPQTFRQLVVATTMKFREQSLTIDTAEDYTRLRPLFERLYARNPAFPYTALAINEIPQEGH
jgi:spore coat polysaccharide biosynthesis protein SpsF (cytidylyltransferase family)